MAQVSFSSITTCVTATVLLVGLAATLTWGEFVYLQHWQPWSRRPSQRHRTYSSFERRARLGLLVAIGLLASVWVPEVRFWLLIALALVTASFARATSFGREGSDEIALIIIVPLALAVSPGATAALRTMSLAFIAAQLSLAYVASACAKIAGSKWRNGSAVAQILSTRDYGVSRRELHGSRRLVFRTMAWGTILVELLVPLLLLMGGPVIVVAIGVGIAFHASVALTMGLNRFFPWFLAAYPAAAWVSLHYGLLST
jgi:hypothetical protein